MDSFFNSAKGGAWCCYGTTAIDTSQWHGGSDDLTATGTGSGCQQVIENLRRNATYISGASAKVGTSGDTTSIGIKNIGVKNYGGSQVSSSVTTTGYTWTTVTFTTGPINAPASVYKD